MTHKSIDPGDYPNRRRFSSPQRIPGTDGLTHCCVYSYTDEGDIVGADCVELDDTYDATWCTTLINNPGLANPVPRGITTECCRDCETLSHKLMIAKCGNRRFVAGSSGIPYTTPTESPEDCCCGDVPRCAQVPGCRQVDCYPEPPDSGDNCDGRCLSMQYDGAGNELVDERDLLCATKIQCCADDNTQCEQRCYDSSFNGPTPPPDREPANWIGPENQWTPMACTSDCGVCCTHVYDTTPNSPTYRQSLMRLGVTSLTKAECEATAYDPNTLGPVGQPVPMGPVGDWVENTDDTNVCNPNCCLKRVRGQAEEVTCHYTDQLFCDACIGRCIDAVAERDQGVCPREFCATKEDCCGPDGVNCRTGVCPDGVSRRWVPLPCGTDGDRCGTCCKILYSDTETEPIGIECDAQTTTRAECERLVDHPAGGQVRYGNWFPFGSCVACGNSVRCCREIRCQAAFGVPGPSRTACFDVLPDECNFCNGRCTELSSGWQYCRPYYDCCGPYGEKCVETCGIPPTHSWDMSCADASKCGVCCKTLYTVNQNTGAITYFHSYCLGDDITSAEECVLTDEERDELGPGWLAVYSWKPWANCDTARCATKKCCGQKCPNGDVGCIDIDIDEPCDPCKGRCFNKNTGEYFCATKQECCGVNGAGCRECPDGTGQAFEWSGCFENGPKCGVCCELLLNNDGDAVGSICREITYEECLALPNANWKAFETCDSAICIPKQCCREVCPGQIDCVTVDKTKDPCNQCEGLCSEVDEHGDIVPGTTFCETERKCCEWDGRRCINYPGVVCPGVEKNRTWSQCQDDRLPECGLACPELEKDLVLPDKLTVSFESSCEQSWFNNVSMELPKTGEAERLPGVKAASYSAGYGGRQNYFCPDVGSFASGSPFWIHAGPTFNGLGVSISIEPVILNGVHTTPYWTVQLSLTVSCRAYNVFYQPYGNGISCTGGYCEDDPTVFRVGPNQMGTYVHPGYERRFSGCATAPPNSFPEAGGTGIAEEFNVPVCSCCGPHGSCSEFECETENKSYTYTEYCRYLEWMDPPGYYCLDLFAGPTPCPGDGICYSNTYTLCSIKRCPENYPVKVTISGADLFPGNPIP